MHPNDYRNFCLTLLSFGLIWLNSGAGHCYANLSRFQIIWLIFNVRKNFNHFFSVTYTFRMTRVSDLNWNGINVQVPLKQQFTTSQVRAVQKHSLFEIRLINISLVRYKYIYIYKGRFPFDWHQNSVLKGIIYNPLNIKTIIIVPAPDRLSLRV